MELCPPAWKHNVLCSSARSATAEVVAGAIGIAGPVSAATPLSDDFKADGYAIFAGVLPEDKFRLVKALQSGGHIVGMCGDGAKSAAGIVLTAPGLAGFVAAVREGRTPFQRILTYVLRTTIHKIMQVLFLAAGLMITGHAVLTPMLMVLLMVTGDFLSMSSSTDTVRPSPKPSVWRIRNLTIPGAMVGMVDLGFCVACLAVGEVLDRPGHRNTA